MVRYIPITKFDGLNEQGLTYSDVIKKDVTSFIDSFIFYSKNINDKDGEIDWMNISNLSNARFVLGVYYNKELDKIVSKDIAQELKKKIVDSIGIDQLLDSDTEQDNKLKKDSNSLPENFLKSLGWDVFDILNQYVKLHNSTLSLWNVLKGHEFFDKRLVAITDVSEKLEKVNNKFKNVSVEYNLETNSKDYIDCSLEYINLLNKAIYLLSEWTRMMGDSRNPDKKSYSKEDINRIFDEYTKAQNKYVEMGDKLKQSFEKL